MRQTAMIPTVHQRYTICSVHRLLEPTAGRLCYEQETHGREAWAELVVVADSPALHSVNSPIFWKVVWNMLWISMTINMLPEPLWKKGNRCSRIYESALRWRSSALCWSICSVVPLLLTAHRSVAFTVQEEYCSSRPTDRKICSLFLRSKLAPNVNSNSLILPSHKTPIRQS
jgi:hypothetical protein